MLVKFVDVQFKDIAQGTKHSCIACPLATAIRRAFNYNSVIDKVEVHGRGKVILTKYDKKEDLVGFLPIVAMNFIKAFDMGLPVHPFSFVLPYETHIQFQENDCRLEVISEIVNDEPCE